MQELLNIDKKFIRKSKNKKKRILWRLGHIFGIHEKFSMSIILWKYFIFLELKWKRY
jgi:hypothetical protein